MLRENFTLPHAAQKMKFSIKVLFSNYDQILNEKLHFLCSVKCHFLWSLLSDFTIRFDRICWRLCQKRIDLEIDSFVWKSLTVDSKEFFEIDFAIFCSYVQVVWSNGYQVNGICGMHLLLSYFLLDSVYAWMVIYQMVEFFML